MKNTRFRLNVNVRVESIQTPEGYRTGVLEVQENVDLPDVESFIQVAEILGAFHELAQRYKKE